MPATTGVAEPLMASTRVDLGGEKGVSRAAPKIFCSKILVPSGAPIPSVYDNRSGPLGALVYAPLGIAGRSLGEHGLIVPRQQTGWAIIDCEATRFTRKPATERRSNSYRGKLHSSDLAAVASMASSKSSCA